MFKLLALLLLITPTMADATRTLGLKHHAITNTGTPVPLCPAGFTLMYARDIVLQNVGAADMAVGDSTVNVDMSVGGILIGAGSAVSLVELLNKGDFYDLCKMYVDGTVAEDMSVTFVSQ